MRTSSSRLTVSRWPSAIASAPRSIARIRCSHHSIPWTRVRGRTSPRVWDDPRGRGVAAVADDVDEARLREDLGQGRGPGDVVGALLDQRQRPVLLFDPEPEQVVEQAPAGRLQVVAVVALEAGEGGVVAVAVDEPVHAAEAVGLKALPPEAAHPLQELLRGHLAGEQAGKAVRVGVEADLDRDQRVAVVARDQLCEHVGAAAAGAADEDQLRRLRRALERLAAEHRRRGLVGGAEVGHQPPVPRFS